MAVKRWIWCIWQVVKAHITCGMSSMFPEKANNIKFRKVPNGYTLVTFKYKGAAYKGHLPPGNRCPPQPWFQNIRPTLLKPQYATDADGKDVTEAMKQYWGPCGNWNRCIGLGSHLRYDKCMRLPVQITFNDDTTGFYS